MKLNELVLLLVAVAILFHGSAAQTRYVVGDALGWTIPSGGASAYSIWAANKTFALGDTLVFNFTNGQHDVAKVSKAVFDGCSSGSTIFTITSSPASVTLNETGEQYYICTFGSHCSLGQKLAVNVTRASSSPAPQPSTPPTTSPSPSPVPAPAPQARPPSPSRVPAPAPAPSSGPVTYTVGDTLGWTIPSNGAAAYQTWASGKTFKVGDILVFNFNRNAHDVAEVTKTKFDSCNGDSPLALYNTPPVRVTLNKSGEHFFLCAITGHCSAGQKLAINVTGSSSTANPPSSTATPPSAATPPSTTTTPTTSSSPSPAGAVSPPPQNSAAESLRVAGLSAALLSIAAALLY